DRYYVPVSIAVPGSAVPPPKAQEKITLDVAGFIRDERNAPVGRIRDTMTVPPASADGLGARQVLYQTGVTLPPGRFSIKVVVRTMIDAADRHAAVFQFEVSAASFKPGLYTCQINVVDEVASKFSFPRLEIYVR